MLGVNVCFEYIRVMSSDECFAIADKLTNYEDVELLY